VSGETSVCLKCHGTSMGITPGIIAHWEASTHAQMGVGCYECHVVPAARTGSDIDNPRYVIKTTWDKESGLKKSELVMKDGKPMERPDIWKHGGGEIVSDVSPRICAQCHEDEVGEFVDSRHSSAGQFIGSVDNFLGRFAEGPAAAINGCQQCHGSKVELASPGQGMTPPVYTPDSWPNTGIGRTNMDGSWGSCSACHSRHEFSSEVARRPENCGKCHMGPDHPQIEIYMESKHGIAFVKNQHNLNIDAPAGEWVLGKDYSMAPTCSSCHMGAVAPSGKNPGLPLTHDVGSRISWTLRPKISIKPPSIVDTDGTVVLKDPVGRRQDMKTVCSTCHSSGWVDNFYVQFDQAVELYNNKYGKPLDAIYEFLISEEIIDNIPMNEEMDYVFFEIWHHEGRRARHGASMMAPDYVQWHGFYELTRNFYTHFLPLAEELAEKAGKLEKTQDFIKATLQGVGGADWEKYHRWTEGLSAEDKAKMLEWEQKTYKESR
ncbi:MAG: multiheme c-type cytochrome, partial [bacterium]